uniref:Reverse transcriptase Ty1/copia-type domain-containing protein n=1 Tax=Cajanus cajan TaxID=3821 RepID=A0A151TUM1_CAJCA|nr:hypothetical protein KK1_009936 [Cajanus cajan]
MHQSLGFRDPDRPNHVCLLKKSLYGLKQAPRAWYKRFANYVRTLGFSYSISDHSLFIYRRGTSMAYLLLYVDDIILTASSDELPKSIISLLSSEFSMKDLGHLSYFLGINVTHHAGGLFLSKPREEHMHALKRILRYIQGTMDLGFHLYPSSTSTLLSYTDADWGGCLDTRRSTSGYCVFLGDNLISWSAKQQPTLS